MNIQSISKNNTNFGQLHAPRRLFIPSNKGYFSSKILLDNYSIRKCAEKYDVHVKKLKRYFDDSFTYALKGAKAGKNTTFETREHRISWSSDIGRVNNLVEEIEIQLREVLMRATAENYPRNGIFKSKDILNILNSKDVKDNFTTDEAFRFGIEQNGESTLLTKFFEIDPKEDDEKDYNKVISIMKSNPKIDFNQKDGLGISVLENIFNLENEKALDLVKDCTFDYTKELDDLYNRIQNQEFKKKASEVKIKFPGIEYLRHNDFSKDSLAFLDSPFCDSKNSAVVTWLNYLENSSDKSDVGKNLFNNLRKYLPDYYKNHYQRERSNYSQRSVQGTGTNFEAPMELKLLDRTISSRMLLNNPEIRNCASEYTVVVKQGAKNVTRKGKIPKILSFLPEGWFEKPTYEYTLKGVKKGKSGNIETQEHLIIASIGIKSYINNLVDEIRKKDQARFYEIVAQKHPARDTFTAAEMLKLLESDEIKGNYNSQEAFSYPITKSGGTLLTKFFDIKETEENKEDYEKLLSIIKATPNLDFNKRSYLEKVFKLENTKALDLFMNMEFAHSEWLDNLYKNTTDENFKNKARNFKMKFPNAIESIKNGIRFSSGWKYVDLSYLESPFCDSRQEAIKIWSELKTQLPLKQCGELNAMLYKYLPENLRMD